MIGSASVIGRALAAVFIVVAYALLAHGFSTSENVATALLPVATAPLLLALMLRRGKWALMLCALAIALLLSLPGMRDGLSRNLAWLYFAQDSALNLALCFFFGRTLRSGNVPLCSRIAIALQPDAGAHLLRYTRCVTLAWTIFFASMVAISLGLFIGADRATWSTFANLLYWPLLLSMFALEYGARWLFLPRADRAGFWATMNAFRTLATTGAAEARS